MHQFLKKLKTNTFTYTKVRIQNCFLFLFIYVSSQDLSPILGIVSQTIDQLTDH